MTADTGVTPEDREAYLSMNMLPEFDAADVRAGLWDKVTGVQAFAAHRLQSVAAATAAKDAAIRARDDHFRNAQRLAEKLVEKDAEIARLRAALTYFANRPTVAEVIEGKHDPMPDTVEARIEEMGRRKREHDEAILQARAALSEAREAGSKD